MGDDDKPTTFLLPHAIRGLAHKVPQRRLDKLVLAAVLVTIIYSLTYTVSSWSSNQYIQNVFISPSGAESVTEEPLPTSTRRPWRPGTTLRSDSGKLQPHFRQPEKTVVVVREGDDVQLDCRLVQQPHAIVTWYKASSTFLTMGKRTYVDDDRIETVIDEDSLNWALRIRDVTLDDAEKYSCHLALAASDIVTVTLDVLPLDEGATPVPTVLPSLVGELFTPGFTETPSEKVCPDGGSGVAGVIAVMSHPQYVSARERIRTTWGMIGAKKDMVVVFGVGAISPAIAANVSAESKRNDDMIVGNYRDVSVDVNARTFKQLSMLQWVAERCPRANFTLVVSHEEFVNARKLREVMSGLDPDQPSLHGRCDGDTTVTRDPSSPLYLPYSAYQRPRLPRFCQSPALLYSRAAIRRTYDQALKQRVLPLADMLITGLAAEAAGVPRENLPEAYQRNQRVETCEYQGFVAGATWGPTVDGQVWKRIVANEKCVG